MKRLVPMFVLCLAGCGADSVLLPVPIPIPIIPPSASLIPLDGRWVLANADGRRSCLVIQESRVSILDLSCSSDGLGLVARIRESPLIARSGLTIVLDVSYNPDTADETVSRLTFVGELQVDGNFVGFRRDETFVPEEDEVFVVEEFALLSRS
ncbi:MAG TPA: hypothetical protein VJZ71_19355 [Phycisphaerae bacterium]|nr:hypothetical protein [Phycisphaerae bacterium]